MIVLCEMRRSGGKMEKKVHYDEGGFGRLLCGSHDVNCDIMELQPEAVVLPGLSQLTERHTNWGQKKKKSMK